MEATNEVLSAYMTATLEVASLPAREFPTGHALAGQSFNPRHAYITVEGGDVRYRLDGTDPVEPFGLLAKDGEAIDWTDPLRDFSAFIHNMRVIATNGATNVLLNISWRN